jgi:hypothetical protein
MVLRELIEFRIWFHVKANVGENLFSAFLNQNGMKQGDALLPLLFKFSLE